jgi:tRNA threonylcarbamoyladenosine biosynthesis protein TsaE
MFTFVADSLADTDRFGTFLAQVLPDSITIGLAGTLGAGKTRLVQAIAAAMGVPRDQVVSPTFVLCHHYEAQRIIYHMDVYRLADEDEFLGLGPEEYFASDGITLIEWADRVEACLPKSRLMIDIEVLSEESRRFLTRPYGSVADQVVAELRSHFPG